MIHTERHAHNMRTSRRCFNNYSAKFIENKVRERWTIIIIMVYSTISTSSMSLKVNDCNLLERLTPPRL
jgi:hypothetical protein